jgi:hypothetical protein
MTMPAGAVFLLPPGRFSVITGPYTSIQTQDPITGLWVTVDTEPSAPNFVESDGFNFRLANLTGTPIGAVITTAGAGYTTTPTVTAAAGGSSWQAIIGGAITSVSITAGGANYSLEPDVFIAPPPFGGLPATAHAVLTSGVITSVTIDNAGAGYTAAPVVTVVPNAVDPNFQATSTVAITTATLTAVVGGANTLTGLVVTNPGSPVTAVPSLTISGGGATTTAVATAVMAFTVASATVSTAGAGYAGSAVQLATLGGQVTATDIVGNPAFGKGLFVPEPAQIYAPVSAGAVGTPVIVDGGLFQSVPILVVLSQQGTTAPTTVAVASITMGSATDYAIVQPL